MYINICMYIYIYICVYICIDIVASLIGGRCPSAHSYLEAPSEALAPKLWNLVP